MIKSLARPGVLGAVAALVLSACAQKAAPPAATPAAPAAAAPQPAWKQGMPASMASSTLAPLAGKMTVTPADQIPINRIKLPPGFKVEIWATGLPGGRAMAMGDNGKIYVGTRGIGRVYEVSDNGSARSVRTVVDKLNQPAGVAYRNGSLYVMAIDKVLRFDGIATNPNAQPVDMTAFHKPHRMPAPMLIRIARIG